jgi:hypothetical protein
MIRYPSLPKVTENQGTVSNTSALNFSEKFRPCHLNQHLFIQSVPIYLPLEVVGGTYTEKGTKFAIGYFQLAIIFPIC